MYSCIALSGFLALAFLPLGVLCQSLTLKLRSLTCLDECGTPGQIIGISDGDDVDDLANCSVVQGSLYIHASGNYTTLDFPSGITTVTGGLFCSGDGADIVTVSITADGLRSIFSNQSAAEFRSIGLVISDYKNLNSLSFAALTTVESDLVLARNPLLQDIDGLKSLSTVNGNLDITGNFNSLDLSSLTLVNGSLNVKSSSPSFDCSQINPGVIVTGSFSCAASVLDPQPLASDNSTTNATAAAPTSSTSASSSAPTSSSTSHSGTSRGIWVSSNKPLKEYAK
jgi:Receptor L domain